MSLPSCPASHGHAHSWAQNQTRRSLLVALGADRKSRGEAGGGATLQSVHEGAEEPGTGDGAGAEGAGEAPAALVAGSAAVGAGAGSSGSPSTAAGSAPGTRAGPSFRSSMPGWRGGGSSREGMAATILRGISLATDAPVQAGVAAVSPEALASRLRAVLGGRSREALVVSGASVGGADGAPDELADGVAEGAEGAEVGGVGEGTGEGDATGEGTGSGGDSDSLPIPGESAVDASAYDAAMAEMLGAARVEADVDLVSLRGLVGEPSGSGNGDEGAEAALRALSAAAEVSLTTTVRRRERRHVVAEGSDEMLRGDGIFTHRDLGGRFKRRVRAVQPALGVITWAAQRMADAGRGDGMGWRRNRAREGGDEERGGTDEGVGEREDEGHGDGGQAEGGVDESRQALGSGAEMAQAGSGAGSPVGEGSPVAEASLAATAAPQVVKSRRSVAFALELSESGSEGGQGSGGEGSQENVGTSGSSAGSGVEVRGTGGGAWATCACMKRHAAHLPNHLQEAEAPVAAPMPLPPPAECVIDSDLAGLVAVSPDLSPRGPSRPWTARSGRSPPRMGLAPGAQGQWTPQSLARRPHTAHAAGGAVAVASPDTPARLDPALGPDAARVRASTLPRGTSMPSRPRPPASADSERPRPEPTLGRLVPRASHGNSTAATSTSEAAPGPRAAPAGDAVSLLEILHPELASAARGTESQRATANLSRILRRRHTGSVHARASRVDSGGRSNNASPDAADAARAARQASDMWGVPAWGAQRGDPGGHARPARQAPAPVAVTREDPPPLRLQRERLESRGDAVGAEVLLGSPMDDLLGDGPGDAAVSTQEAAGDAGEGEGEGEGADPGWRDPAAGAGDKERAMDTGECGVGRQKGGDCASVCEDACGLCLCFAVGDFLREMKARATAERREAQRRKRAKEAAQKAFDAITSEVLVQCLLACLGNVFYHPAQFRAAEALQVLMTMKAKVHALVARNTDKGLADLLLHYPPGMAVSNMTEQHVQMCAQIAGDLMGRFSESK